MGKYKVILADPPWSFQTYSKKGKGRSAEAHYDCLSFEEIKILPVNEWADENCVLFLWITDPFLLRAKEVIESWGFEYKTVGFYWVKGNWLKNYASDFSMGLGHWTRANPEPCLLATKGRPKRRSGGVRKLLISPRREHSRKPDEIYNLIEALCEGPYLELFARFHREGWTSWGNEEGIGKRRWGSKSYPRNRITL